MSAVLTVSELTRAVGDVLEAEFPFVWVRGQVANLSRPASGHLYFSLSDGRASLSVVWFKSAQWRGEPGEVHPLTGEVADGSLADDLDTGMEVLVAGRLNVYEARGQYQLVAELVQEQGVGDLQLAFEAMKRDLAAKGYFDVSRKRPLPRNPLRVAVVTSASGAAVRDFVRVARERAVDAELRIFPCLVQGDKAPGEIAAAMAEAVDDGWPQVVALIRGGGSLEDLWAFNTEPVAEAVHSCPVPVVTGVGHEPDVSIADLTADVRAATPTHAAQLLWTGREYLAQEVDRHSGLLLRAFGVFLDRHERRLREARQGLMWLSPERRLERAAQEFTGLVHRLDRAGKAVASGPAAELERTVRRLSAAHGTHRVDKAGAELAGLARRLRGAVENRAGQAAQELGLLATKLDGLDPFKPLERGYSLVTVRRTGAFLRAASDVEPGDRLSIRTGDGEVDADVTGE